MNITYCQRCGGIMGMSYGELHDYSESNELPAVPLNLCPGHPEPVPARAMHAAFEFRQAMTHIQQIQPVDPERLEQICTNIERMADEPPFVHDGRIDEYTASLQQGKVTIAAPYADPQEEGMITLSPTQALSLLSWLEQERETLEQLAGGDEP